MAGTEKQFQTYFIKAKGSLILSRFVKTCEKNQKRFKNFNNNFQIIRNIFFQDKI